MKIHVKKKAEVDVYMVEFRAKIRDEGTYVLYDQNKNILADATNEYVPDWIPGEYGDYIELQIDVETGQILNWVKPSPEQLAEFIDKFGVDD